jgi:hypothetical protein
MGTNLIGPCSISFGRISERARLYVIVGANLSGENLHDIAAMQKFETYSPAFGGRGTMLKRKSASKRGIKLQ